MLFVKLKAKKSKVHGTGCFAVGRIRRGTVIAFWGDAREVRVLTAQQHIKKFKSNSAVTHQTAVRMMGDWFVESIRLEDKDPTDYMNYSARPNVGYMGGLLFALKNIAAGAEMFLDYRLLNADYEVNVVRGLNAKRQLRASADQVKKAFSGLGRKK